MYSPVKVHVKVPEDKRVAAIKALREAAYGLGVDEYKGLKEAKEAIIDSGGIFLWPSEYFFQLSNALIDAGVERVFSDDGRLGVKELEEDMKSGYIPYVSSAPRPPFQPVPSFPSLQSAAELAAAMSTPLTSVMGPPPQGDTITLKYTTPPYQRVAVIKRIRDMATEYGVWAYYGLKEAKESCDNGVLHWPRASYVRVVEELTKQGANFMDTPCFSAMSRSDLIRHAKGLSEELNTVLTELAKFP